MNPPTVLVVDDSPVIRQMLEAALRRHGFAVRLATTGDEALAAYTQHRGDIGVVLMDVELGHGMDGPQTLAALKRLDPGVRCLLMTGGIPTSKTSESPSVGAVRVLPKPFPSVDELVRVLREAIRE